MNGIIRKKTFLIALIIAAALSAAIFAVLYYSGSLLPKWANWKDVTVYGEDGDEPDEIILKNRRVRAYRNGECIFRSPTGCLVQDILYTDIDRDGEKELLLLNFNIGRYGDHRPFWVKSEA